MPAESPKGVESIHRANPNFEDGERRFDYRAGYGPGTAISDVTRPGRFFHMNDNGRGPSGSEELD